MGPPARGSGARPASSQRGFSVFRDGTRLSPGRSAPVRSASTRIVPLGAERLTGAIQSGLGHWRQPLWWKGHRTFAVRPQWCFADIAREWAARSSSYFLMVDSGSRSPPVRAPDVWQAARSGRGSRVRRPFFYGGRTLKGIQNNLDYIAGLQAARRFWISRRHSVNNGSAYHGYERLQLPRHRSALRHGCRIYRPGRCGPTRGSRGA
jgi:hypothetical protein